MPRYFFTVHDGRVIPDHEGSVLSGPEEARAEAAAIALQLLRDATYSAIWNGKEWRVVVTDEDGKLVLTLSFNAVVKASPD